MNVEYVRTINNQKLTTKMLFVKTFFMESLSTYSALHPFIIPFFAVILKAKITCITVKCVIHFMTAHLTVPLGVVGGLHSNLNEKNRLQNS